MARSGKFGGNGNGYSGDMTVGEYVNGWPTIRVSDFIRAFLRQIPFMFIVFVVIAAIGFAVGMTFKRDYIANGRLIVKPSADLTPISGSNDGVIVTPEVVVQTEIGIMKSNAVIDRVLSRVDISELSPELATKLSGAGSKPERDLVLNDIYKTIDESFSASASPKAYSVDVGYKHENPETAVKALNLFIEEYLSYRRVVYGGEDGALSSDRVDSVRVQLDDANSALQQFLSRNNISSFTSDQTSAQTRLAAVRTLLSTTQADLVEAESTLNSLEARLRIEPEKIDLFVEDELRQRINRAESERQQLLAKYLPGSQPVLAKEAEIRQLQQQSAANNGAPTGGRRVGPNPVHQQLKNQKITVEARANALRDKEAELVAQVKALDGRVRLYQRIAPEYDRLNQERTTATSLYDDVAAREATQALSERSKTGDSVNIIDQAVRARKGPNMKKIVWALSIVGAAFTALMLGLLRAFLDPKLYGGTPSARRRRTSDYQEPDYYNDGLGYGTEPEPVYKPAPQPAAPAYQPAAAYQQAAPAQAAAPTSYHDAPAHADAHSPQPGYYDEPSYDTARSEPQNDGYQTSFGLNRAQAAPDMPYEAGNPYASAADPAQPQPESGQPQQVYREEAPENGALSGSNAPVIAVVPWANT